MTILVGTCSWTDRVIEQTQRLYSTTRPTSEQKLRYYSTLFPTVEVDASFYALPSIQTCRLWAQRTPDDFTFHVKAFSLFTTHRTRTQALPADLRQTLPHDLQTKPQLNLQEVPGLVKEELWKRYREALEPLEQSGKLGFILLQFAPWFRPTRQAANYVLFCQEQLTGFKVAVEFRNREWFEGRLKERTPEFLQDNGLTMVCVDMPQGFNTSIPPIAEATTTESYIRLHGRNVATWEQAGVPVNNIHDYWYAEDELEDWLEKVRHLEEKADKVYVLFNTVQGLHTALQFQRMVFPVTEQPSMWGSNGTNGLV